MIKGNQIKAWWVLNNYNKKIKMNVLKLITMSLIILRIQNIWCFMIEALNNNNRISKRKKKIMNKITMKIIFKVKKMKI